MKINSFYKEHTDAIKCLEKFGIELKIIPNESPYLLAQDNPDIVIHPKSNMLNGEYPLIKFVGPNCNFPNYDYTPEFGFDALSKTDKKINIKSKCSLINTLGDDNLDFIRKLEKEYYVRIWGRPINHLGYMGPLNCNSYEIYNNSEFCAADNESEILKVLSLNKFCYIPFNYMDGKLLNTINLLQSDEEKDKTKLFINQEEFLKSKNWINIFNKLFKICGENEICVQDQN